MNVQKILDRSCVCLRFTYSIPVLAYLLALYFFHPPSWEDEEDWLFSFLVFLPFLPPSWFLWTLLFWGCAMIEVRFRSIFLWMFICLCGLVCTTSMTFWFLFVCWLTFYLLHKWRNAFSSLVEFRWIHKLSQQLFYTSSAFFFGL